MFKLLINSLQRSKNIYPHTVGAHISELTVYTLCNNLQRIQFIFCGSFNSFSTYRHIYSCVMARQHQWARALSLWRLYDRTQFEPVFPTCGQPLGSAANCRSLIAAMTQYKKKNCPFGVNTFQPKNVTTAFYNTDTIFSQNFPAKYRYCQM